MNRKLVLWLTLMLLVGVLSVAFNVQNARASGTIYIRADGSIEPPDAPISTLDNATYTLTGNITADAEGIVIQRDNIVIDGAGCTVQGINGHEQMGMDLSWRSNVTIKSTEITKFFYGIWIHLSSDITISENNITNDAYGIWLQYSSTSSISGNNIANNWNGIWMRASSNCSVSGNAFTNDCLIVWSSYQNSVENNTVNGRPLVYLEGVSNHTVGDAGQVTLVRCENIRVEGLNLSGTDVGVMSLETNNSTFSGNNIANNAVGIELDYSSNCSISGNNVTNNIHGIELVSSSNCSISGNNITANDAYGIGLPYSSDITIFGNSITANEEGIWLFSSSNCSISENDVAASNYYGIELVSSSDNKVFHNNFANNTVQAYLQGSNTNAWDDGYPSGGNYWSDYNGTDSYHGAYQNETRGDGIGDAPRVINTNNTDRYPFMKPFSSQTVRIGIKRFAAEKTAFPKDYVLNISVDVVNYGVEDQTSNVTFSVNSTELGTVSNALFVFRLTSVTFTWNTSGRDFGKYVLGAVVSPLPNETDASDNVAEDLWVTITIVSDINGDFVVDIYDALVLSATYGSAEGDSRWNPNANLLPVPDPATGKQTVDIFDAIVLSAHYGQEAPYP